MNLDLAKARFHDKLSAEFRANRGLFVDTTQVAAQMRRTLFQ